MIRKYINMVTETPQAMVGDWEGSALLIGNLSRRVYDMSWETVGKLILDNTTYDIIKQKNLSNYMVGLIKPKSTIDSDPRAVNDEFGYIFSIHMHKGGSLTSGLGYPNLFQIDYVGVHEDFRGIGIAKSMYKWFVDNDMNLISDSEQYFGARALWASLSRESNYTVDVIDFDAMKIIDKGVVFYQGKADADFDRRFYSYTEEKKHIRFVLCSIQ